MNTDTDQLEDLRETIKRALQTLAREIGRTPMTSHIRIAAREGKCPSPEKINEAYGSLEAALKAAGLAPNYNQAFSESELVEQLRTLSTLLERRLTPADVHRAGLAGQCARRVTFLKVFGTVYRALCAAGVAGGGPRKDQRERGLIAPPATGLRINHPGRFGEQELVDQLRMVSKTLGRKLIIADIANASRSGECGRIVEFRRAFGTLAHALKLAGVAHINTPGKKELRDRYLAFARQLGRTPTVADITAGARAGKCPSMRHIIRLYGGLKALREETGRIGRRLLRSPARYSSNELIVQLQTVAMRLGRIPTCFDLHGAGRIWKTACSETFRSRFGSWKAALRAAGLRPKARPRNQRRGDSRRVIGSDGHGRTRWRNREVTKGDLLRHYIALSEELGRPPSSTDVIRAAREGKCPGYRSFRELYGGLTAFRLAEGLPCMETGKPRHSIEDILEQLRQLGIRLGRTPTLSDIEAANRRGETVSVVTFRRRFGSLNWALAQAGFTIEPLD